MTLRLTTTQDAHGSLIKADGRLDTEVLQEFLSVCEGAPGPLRLDLSELLGADTAGITSLKGLRDSGVELVHVRPFLKMLIERDP